METLMRVLPQYKKKGGRGVLTISFHREVQLKVKNAKIKRILLVVKMGSHMTT